MGMMFLFFLFMLGNSHGSNTDETLHIIIPSSTISIPTDVEIGLVKISLPNIDASNDNGRTGINGLLNLLTTMDPFSDKNTLDAFPLNSLGNNLALKSGEILTLIDQYNLLKNKEKPGQDVFARNNKPQKIITPDVQSHFPHLAFLNFNSLVSQLKVYKDNKVSPTTYVNSPGYSKILYITEHLLLSLEDIYNELSIYIQFLDSIHNNDLKKLNNYPLKNYFHKELGLHTIMSVVEIKGTELFLQIGLYESFIDLLKYTNVEYYNYALANQFYSKLEPEQIGENLNLFELACTLDICDFKFSKCSQSIANLSVINILTYCDFERKTRHTENIFDIGFLLQNEEHGKAIDAILETNNASIEQYPALLKVDTCLDTDLHNFKSFCTNSIHDFQLIYSVLEKSKILKHFNSKLISNLFFRFGDITFVLAVVTMILLFYCSCNFLVVLIRIAYRRIFRQKRHMKRQMKDENIPLERKKIKSKILKNKYSDIQEKFLKKDHEPSAPSMNS